MTIMTKKAVAVFAAFLCAGLAGARPPRQAAASPSALLPKPSGWTPAEEVKIYRPETLFEYIDGAAEAYIGYDFKELAVAQFKDGRSPATLTIEVYDMGADRNAFGIYAAERYPESRFLPVGVQGYYEEGSLNFFQGSYYVKLLAFDAGDKTEAFLRQVAAEIGGKVKDPGGFPAPLAAFPREGLVANSEKFFLRNVMGFRFLANGFLADYAVSGQEFSCFLIEGGSPRDAEAMWTGYLDHFRKNGRSVAETPDGARINDPYLRNIFVKRVGRHLCGVIKIGEGAEKTGEAFLERMAQALAGRGG